VSLLFFLGSPNKGNSIFNFNLGANWKNYVNFKKKGW
jgi:hypothetical protein